MTKRGMNTEKAEKAVFNLAKCEFIFVAQISRVHLKSWLIDTFFHQLTKNLLSVKIT